jgi:hypoxanthine phosphoribosyltransferase
MPKLERLTWRKFDNDCLKIADHVRGSGKKIDGIYGFPRGGLVLAVKLSHILEQPLVLDEKKVGATTLVVDDIADSGKTLSNSKAAKKAALVCTIYKHENTTFIPDFHVRVKKKQWILFPWETERTTE